jgi:cardiolipin synthase
MTIVRVAIPIFRGKRRFYLDKGRLWSAIEHLILIALASRPQTAAQLAAEAKLPRRLIIEVVIRLMRAGWVELSQNADGSRFAATSKGKKAAELDELPNVSKRIARWMNFLVDRVTGTIYRGRELPFFEKHLLEERAQRERFVWIQPRGIDAIAETHAVVATLFNDDERFVAMEQAGDRLVERFALVSVRAGKVEGLPSRAPRELEKLILDAVGHAPAVPAGPQSPLYEPAPLPAPEDRRPPAPREIAFTSRDLIVGAKEHNTALLTAIRRARQCIIIHSTFIRQDKFAAIQPMLLEAVRRGAQVDILWGEDEAKTETTATRAVVAALRRQVAELGFERHVADTPVFDKVPWEDRCCGRRFIRQVPSDRGLL